MTRKKKESELIYGPRKRHGHSYPVRTKTYQTWTSIKKRLFNPACDDYPEYGGRGIEMCDRWLKFENFLADMGECPVGMTIERIDNDRDYSPDNCKWATRLEQTRNRSNTVMVEYGGESIPLAVLSDKLDIKHNTLYSRLKMGWSLDKAVSTPVRNRSC